MRDRQARVIYMHVRHVDLFPGAKKAEIEHITNEGSVTYELLGSVWEAVFDGAVAKFKTCSYVRMVYGGQGICVWDPKNKKFECRKGS